jgi:hypothetical protein
VLLVAASTFVGCELASLVAEATEEEDRGLADGAFCTADDECGSGRCTTYQLCAHSTCDCPGDACAETGDRSPDCHEDWVCTDNKFFDRFREFFGGDPRDDRGYCQAPCTPACPEHYVCNGQFCLPDSNWTAPVATISWSGAVSGSVTGRNASESLAVEEGQTLMLSASATSPLDAKIETYRWILHTAQGTVESDQQAVEIAIEAGSFQRAELTVLDEKSRNGSASVIFEPCGGAGKTCGYQGSGCCNGCDDATDTCI